jgi:hypothetical protein
MRHLRPAALVAAAVVVAATSACTPITIPASPPPIESPIESPIEQHGGTADNADQCQPGWVCGTCPDGSTWGYLNDPQYTSDPQVSTLFFDDKRPCG